VDLGGERMQIYDDSKKRIGTLTGFRNRAIATTLDSGDKELSFEYPAHGGMVDLLKEEYYIRTKTDEFVLKAVEKSADYNKYTAQLNVEEFEGQSFPYGFMSQEQTIRACLEFAFDGIGWTVGTCTITKKRTIDIEESATAWDVLQQCLKTYRCECKIDSLNKKIHIYEAIGQDRGCYFMEGLNLRKLTLNSDTYEFWTRIIPIGKDGITIEWLHGKEYLENYQYSTKIKTYTWKDERYTDTTSLMEDTEAKLEEMSKPYKAYTADVVDLARANPEYSDVLDYGIGDSVTLVSKRTGIREKQRIVKIVENPEQPEKNTVELSNMTKTFAEVQKSETELAKQEAISIANSTTKKILGNYSTTEETETKITASTEAIELLVSRLYQTKDEMAKYSTTEETKTLLSLTTEAIELLVSRLYQTKDEMTKYSTTEETKTLLNLSTEAIELLVSRLYQTKDEMTKYSTTEETKTLLNLSTEAIELLVSRFYQTKDEMAKYSTTEETKTLLSLTTEAIELLVSKTYATQKNLDTAKASIQVNATGIEAKVSKGDVSTQISAESDAITLKSNRLSVESNNFSLSKTGEVIATGTFTSKDDSQSLQSVQAGAGIKILYNGSEIGRFASGSSNGEKGIGIGTGKFMTFNNGSSVGYIYNHNGYFTQYAQRHIFTGDTYFTGGIAVGGTKNRAVKTEHFGVVGMNALETASPLFGDAGSGETDESGYCYVMLDGVFQETIDGEHNYYVLISETSEKECRCIAKEADYFVVRGETKATFDWILFAKQKGYSDIRMNAIDVPNDAAIENMDMTPIEDFGDDIERLATEYLIDYEKEIINL